MDLGNEQKRIRFWKARKSSEMALDSFRENRRNVIERYVGSEYGSKRLSRTRKKTLVNAMLSMVSTYSLMLAANNPRVKIETHFRGLNPFAKQYEIATNNLLIEIDANSTFQRIVEDAIFGIGIGKVYFAPGNPVQVPNPNVQEPSYMDGPDAWDNYRKCQNILIDAGRPFFERVSLDDFNFDMSAPCWEKTSWQSHDYRLPMDEVMDDPRIDAEVKKMIKPDSKWQSRRGGVERAADIGKEHCDVDELEDMVTLSDVYFPRYKKWALMSAKDENLPPLFMEDWRGCETGPFLTLSFFTVPDSIMPVSLAGALAPIHDAINVLQRKATWSAINYKELLTYKGSGEDVQNIVNASHLETVRVNNPESVKQMAFNGVNQGVVAQAQLLAQQFSRDAGNLDSMAGLGPQSQTARQDQLIKDSTNTQVNLMKNRMYSYAEKVVRNLGWMLWVDQTKTLPGQMYVEGLKDPIPAHWTPEDREGDFWQYNFSVEPYSLELKSPTDKITQIEQLVAFYASIEQSLMQQGIAINWQAINELQASYRDMPAIRDLLLFGGQPQNAQSNPTGRAPGASSSLGQDPNRGVGRYIKQTQSSPQEQQAKVTQSLVGSVPQGNQGAMQQ